MISIVLEYTSFNSAKHCFNPEEGKSIMLPNGFGVHSDINIKNISKDEALTSIKCPIFTCMLKDSDEYNMFTNKNKINLQYYKLYEKYLFFIGTIYRSYLYKLNTIDTSMDEIPTIFFSMNSNSKSSLISNSLGMNKRNVTRMVNFMIKYNFLELYSDQHSFIDYKKGETILDLKCRHFIVSPQFYRYPIKYSVRTDNIIEHIRRMYSETVDEILDDTSATFEKDLISDRMITSYTFPNVEKLEEIAEKMVNSGEVDKYGRQYSFGIPKEWYSEDNGKTITRKKDNGETFTYTIRGKLKPNCPYVDINVHIYNYILMMNGPKVLRKRKIYYNNGEEYKDRFYYFLAMIPKWIRNEIKIDGENIKEIDATAMHPRIIGKLYENYTNNERPEFLVDDSHTKIAKMLGINRKDAKLLSLSYWNSKIVNGRTVSSKRNGKLFKQMDDYIINNYPKLFDFLIDIKCNTKPIKRSKSRHTNMSVLLMNEETNIINNFYWDLKYTLGEYNLTTLYCYDSIAVKESKYKPIKELFDASVNQYLN